MTIEQRFSNNGARSSKGVRYNAKGGVYEPGNKYKYKIFINNCLSYSEWGGCKLFSLSMGGGLPENNSEALL